MKIACLPMVNSSFDQEQQARDSSIPSCKWLYCFKRCSKLQEYQIPEVLYNIIGLSE